jgi:N-acetylated-alpha-linked acidic dipeptidase
VRKTVTSFPISEEQKEIEEEFVRQIDHESVWNYMHAMSTLSPVDDHPLMGTDAHRRKLHYIRGKLLEFGYEPEVQEFLCEQHFPLETRLEIISPVEKEFFAVPMRYGKETPEEGITGELVWVGDGWEEDYKRLERDGVTVNGKIVLISRVRGHPKSRLIIAKLHEARGVIIRGIYDLDWWGYQAGGQYGPLRMLLRGHPEAWVEDDARMYEFYKFPEDSLQNFPVFHVRKSIGDYLRKLCAGKGSVIVSMKFRKNVENRKTYNIIATLEGSELPEEVVVLGAHSDSWFQGARDDTSGCATVLEMARILSRLAEKRWGPRRTMKFCFWTGEESSMVGSEAYASEHETVIQKIVAKFNLETGVMGHEFIGGSGSPEFKSLCEKAGKDALPETQFSYTGSVTGATSDHSPFFWRNIPVINGFSWQGKGWLDATEDTLQPGPWSSVSYHKSLAQSWSIKPERFHEVVAITGVTALRIANSPILPYEYASYASLIKEGLDRQDGLLALEEGADMLGVDLSSLIEACDKMGKAAEKLNDTLIGVSLAHHRATGCEPLVDDLPVELVERFSGLPSDFSENRESIERYIRIANAVMRKTLTAYLRTHCYATDGQAVYLLPWIAPMKYAADLEKRIGKLQQVIEEVGQLKAAIETVTTTLTDLSENGNELLDSL